MVKKINSKASRHRRCLLLLVVILAVAVLAGCSDKGQANPNDRDQSLLSDLLSKEPQNVVVAFFPDLNNDNLISLSFAVNSTRDIARLALEKLVAGPPSDFVRPALPQGVKVQDVYFADNQVGLYLAGDMEVKPEDVNFAALSATINFAIYDQTQNGGASLKVYYNDKPLSDEAYPAKYVNDYSDDGSNAAYVLYSDSQAMYMVPIRVSMKNTEGDGYYKELLQNWAGNPPKNSGVSPVAPAGAQILNCSLDQKGTLTVDLNKAAVNYGGGTARETMLLNTLLATLRPYEEIKNLQIVIEGQKMDYLPEGTDISTVLPVSHAQGNLNKVN